MTEKGVKAFRKANPGSKLKTAVTEDKPSPARAARRKSFLCSLCGSNEEVSRGCQGSGQPSSSSEKKVEVLDHGNDAMERCAQLRGRNHGFPA
jgi:hypothetical protein